VTSVEPPEMPVVAARLVTRVRVGPKGYAVNEGYEDVLAKWASALRLGDPVITLTRIGTRDRITFRTELIETVHEERHG
jgi:hypothetical protein